MLNYKTIKNFFNEYPEGYIGLVLPDCVFKLTKDIAYSLDMTSITFMDITYTDKKYGNEYVRKGNFMIPFGQIIRVEYIKTEYGE